MTADLHSLALLHGTDKAGHGYCPVYEQLLSARRQEPLRLLEIGILQGASLRMWLDWFPAAEVHGLDPVLPEKKLEHPRLTLHRGYQEDWRLLRQLFPADSLDVVIDDGSHRLEHQLVTAQALWDSLRSGGVYVIEDIQGPAELEILERLPGWRRSVRTGDGQYDRLVILGKGDCL